VCNRCRPSIKLGSNRVSPQLTPCIPVRSEPKTAKRERRGDRNASPRDDIDCAVFDQIQLEFRPGVCRGPQDDDTVFIQIQFFVYLRGRIHGALSTRNQEPSLEKAPIVTPPLASLRSYQLNLQTRTLRGAHSVLELRTNRGETSLS